MAGSPEAPCVGCDMINVNLGNQIRTPYEVNARCGRCPRSSSNTLTTAERQLAERLNEAHQLANLGGE